MLTTAAFTIWVLAHSQPLAKADAVPSCQKVRLESGPRPDIECINASKDGGKLDTRVAQLFLANCQENSVIASFRKSWNAKRFDVDLKFKSEPPQSSCEISTANRCNTFRSQLADLAFRVRKNFEPSEILNPSCVERSMQSISAAYGGTGAKTHLCKSDLDVPSVISGPPCVTEEMAEYMAWITTKAATCVAPPDRPLNLLALLKQFTNESHFGFFINGKNGRGFTQMTPVAIAEMRRTEGGFRTIQTLQAVLDKGAQKSKSKDFDRARVRACEVFKDVLSTEMKIQEAPKDRRKARAAELTGSEENCMLNQPGIGTARAALFGAALFVYYRDHFGKNGSLSMSATAGQWGSKWPSIPNLGAQIAYGFAGQSRALATIEAALAKVGCQASKPANSCFEGAVLSAMESIHAKSRAATLQGFSYIARNEGAVGFLLPNDTKNKSVPTKLGPEEIEKELRNLCVY